MDLLEIYKYTYITLIYTLFHQSQYINMYMVLSGSTYYIHNGYSCRFITIRYTVYFHNSYIVTIQNHVTQLHQGHISYTQLYCI